MEIVDSKFRTETNESVSVDSTIAIRFVIPTESRRCIEHILTQKLNHCCSMQQTIQKSGETPLDFLLLFDINKHSSHI